jgi:hypothetical protein
MKNNFLRMIESLLAGQAEMSTFPKASKSWVKTKKYLVPEFELTQEVTDSCA